jgi:hypothetical protein
MHTAQRRPTVRRRSEQRPKLVRSSEGSVPLTTFRPGAPESGAVCMVIVGSSAGALTGLQFVVMALVADVRTRSSSLEIAAFGTPTVVHFCGVLFMSGILSAPWPAVELPRDSTPALFVIGGAALLLLFVGIHNAWDAVTFIVVQRLNPQADSPNA